MMRLRRYKVVVSNSNGVFDTAFFITQGGAAEYILSWSDLAYSRYENGSLLDPCLFFAMKKWDGKSRYWKYVLTYGGRRYLEDRLRGSIK